MALTTAARLALSLDQASPQSERPLIDTRAATSVIAHPRVDGGVEDVDDEVEQNGEHGDDNHRSHDQRVVPVEGALDEIAADAGNGEDGLDDDRTGEKSCRSGT